MTYPYGSIDATKVDATVLLGDHAPHHDTLASALNDLLAELGVDPSGAFASLTARLTNSDSLINPLALSRGGTGTTVAPDALVALAAEVLGAAGAHALPPAGESSTVQRFHRDFVNRSTTPLKIMYIGDSEFDFSQCNRSATYQMGKICNPQNRQFSGPGALLAAGSTMPGDVAFGLGAVSPSTWVSVGSPTITSAAVQNHRGMAGCALKMTDGQACQLISAVWDHAKFFWLTPLAGSGATLEFFVDGVSVHTSTSTAAGSFDYSTGTAPAAHVIKIVSHGENLFDFVQMYSGNHDAWLQPISAVHSGYTTGDFANSCTDLAGYIASFDPSVVVLEPGVNDADAPTYYTDMTTLIGTVRANTTATVLLFLPNAVLGRTTWNGWRQRAKRLEAEQNVLLCDVSNWMPDLSVSDPLGYTSDGVHMQPTGANGRDIWANAIVASLFTGRVRDFPLWESGSTFGGFPGHVRVYDNNQGGIALGWFLQRADTQPYIRISSEPNNALNGMFMGPGGTSGADCYIIRLRPGVMGVEDSFSLGASGSGALVTGARLATNAPLPACTAAGSGAGKTLTGNSNGALAAIDFVTPAANNRIIVKDQANQADNGLYALTQLGDVSHPFILTRTTGSDSSNDYASGIVCFIGEGLNYGGSYVRSRPTTVTVDTTPIIWTGPGRSNTTPADIRFGSNRAQQRYDSDFEDTDGTVSGAGGRWAVGQPTIIFLSGTTGAQASQQQNAEVRCGVIGLETGTNVAGWATFTASARPCTFNTGRRHRYFALQRLDTNLPVVSPGDDYTVWQGFLDSTGLSAVTDPTAGMFFRTDRATGNWFAVCRHAGTETATNSGVPYSSAYTNLRIDYDETAQTASFFINTTAIPPISTNLPTSGDVLHAGCKVKKLSGTANRIIYTDYFEADMVNSRSLNQSIP
jgi:lysophospholipase L1-like esterase